MADSNGFMGALLPALLLGILSGGGNRRGRRSGGLLGMLLENEQFNNRLRAEERSKHANMQRGTELNILSDALVDAMTKGKKNLFTDKTMDYASQVIQSDPQLMEMAKQSAAEKFAQEYLLKEAKSFNDVGMTPPKAFTNYNSTTEDLLRTRSGNSQAFRDKATIPSLLSMMAQQNVPPGTTREDVYSNPTGMLGNIANYREAQKNADAQRSKGIMAYQKSLYPNSGSGSGSGKSGSGLLVSMKDFENSLEYIMPSTWSKELGNDYEFTKEDIMEMRDNVSKNIDILSEGNPDKAKQLIDLTGKHLGFDFFTTATLRASAGVPYQIPQENAWKIGLGLAKQGLNSTNEQGKTNLTEEQINMLMSIKDNPDPEYQKRIGETLFKQLGGPSVFETVNPQQLQQSPVTGGIR